MWRKLLAASASFLSSSLLCDPSQFIEGLPEFSLEEVSNHRSPGKSVWLIVGRGIYDITDFIKIHPGGDKILLAAGRSADPFWNLYQIHKQEKVYQILETMRIGNLKKGEILLNPNDPYLNDPQREPIFLIHSEKPFNGELPNERISESLITPNEQFFIRNHLPVPVLTRENYELEIVFEDDKCSTLNFNDLVSKFSSVEVESSIQCAGNRRAEANQLGVTRGVEWKGGAIGNAKWKGVRVRDIIRHFGALNPEYRHLHVEAYDTDPNGPFGTSIPIEKALDEDTILAFEMNGEILPRDHGHPVRLIVPGYIGIRNIKWVKRITLSKSESSLNWHRRDYRLFSPNDSMENVEFDKRVPIYDCPVQSMILNPFDGASFENNKNVELAGFAYSGGGRGISRVDVTPDGGNSWVEAELEKNDQPNGKEYGWTLWKAQVPSEDIEGEVCVRAVDSAGNTQPEKLGSVWNYRGLLVNSWHCIKISPKEPIS
jgi:sulfite oxidase